MERRVSSSSTTRTRGPWGDGREPTSWDIGPPGGLKAAVGPLHEEGGHGNRGNLAVEEVRRCEEGDRLALSTLVSGDVLRSSVTNTGMASIWLPPPRERSAYHPGRSRGRPLLRCRCQGG